MTELFAGPNTVQMRLAAGNAIAGTTSQLRTLMNDVINVKDSDYGATGDGVTDDTASFLAAIASFPAKGGVLYVPAGTYVISEVHVDKPILLECEGWMDVAPNSAGSGVSLVQFNWGGGAGGYMFVFSKKNSTEMLAGTTDGENLFNCGIVGAQLDGLSNAGFGIWLASTVRAKVHVHIRSFTDTNILVDGGNGRLSLRNEFNVHSIHGAGVPVENAHGIVFRRFNGFTTTQNRILLLEGTTKNGDMVRVGDSDNNQFWHLHASTIGTGVGLRLINADGTGASSNVIWYFVGDAYCESLATRNRIIHAISEGSSVTIDAGGQLHYVVLDYVNGELFKTHSFKMSDKLFVPAHALRPDGTNATSAIASGIWSGIRFQAGVDGAATGAIALPYSWNDGNITGFEILFSMETANTSKTVELNIRLETAADGDAISVADKNESFVVAVPDAVDTFKIATVTFAAAQAYLFDEMLILNFRRLGGTGGSDNALGDFSLYGLRALYTSTGPNSPGSGPYDDSPAGV